MPSIWKRLTHPKAEPYQFPNAEDIVLEDAGTALPSFDSEEDGPASLLHAEELSPEPEPEPEPEDDPVLYAQIQAEQIVQDAERRAREVLEQAEAEARQKAEELYAAARKDGFEEGRAEGVIQGVAQALEENRQTQAQQAAELSAEVEKFLQKAGAALDRQMDDNVEELRDLAIAIAEKVVCVSLKSSSEVIGRMIQTAVDKRKRREWAHIYIAECDAKYFTKVPAALTAALSSLSDRVRIIPMADDEAGTCIIEMPDEIIDASAATQLNNIRTLLADAPASGYEDGMNFGGM
ncbi:MAG: F0F1 ATP synthase subunit delta [Oscillibacter sp.]|nr:F0F1 ATP synthase subunit delta [Oscillibacter sp.]